MNNQDEIISETPEYSLKSEFSKAAIVFKASEMCRDLRAVEMRDGFYNYKLDKEGEIIAKVWNSDSRKAYVSSVEALRILLIPEILRDSKMKEKIYKLQEKKKDLFDKYSIEKDEERFIPAKGYEKKETYSVSTGNYSIHPNKSISKTLVGFYDLKINIYWDRRVELADEVFEVLNILIDSLNYFKAGASF